MDLEDRVLVVDLDMTLLRTDMLYESFFSALGRDWRNLFVAMAALLKGRSKLKRSLAKNSNVDFATLPYNGQVISFVKAWRDAGGRTALVTGSDSTLAEGVSEYLGLFDEVHGSDGTRNLKSRAKAEFLEDRFGPKAFSYMGDARPDLEVWKRAEQAITVNAPQALRRKVEQVCDSTLHLADEPRTARPYLQVMRPHQWTKNALVFLPALTSHQLNSEVLLDAFVGFVCFCLVASGAYVLNDLLDIKADRAHPRKRSRPFALGRIPLTQGGWISISLICLGIGLAAAKGGYLLPIALLYLALTTAYSLKLKRIIVADIFTLAALYNLRIVAGGAVTGIDLSIWLVAFSSFLFLSLAAVKRQVELIDNGARGNEVILGRGYHVDDIPIVSMIALGAGYISVLVLMLYSDSSSVVELYSNPQALWGACVVLFYWITKTVMVAHRGQMHDDPVVYAFRDRTSQICLLIVLLVVIVASVG